MAKQPIKSKKAGSPRRAARSAAAAKLRSAARACERDPRLPAPGTTLTRAYKRATIRVTVLEDGFRHGGREWRSLSALASELCGNSANGYLWFGLTAPRSATPTSSTLKDSTTRTAIAKRRAPKRSKTIRRAGRDPQPAPTADAALSAVPDAVSAPETSTA